MSPVQHHPQKGDWYKAPNGRVYRVRSKRRGKLDVFTCDIYVGGGNFQRTTIDVEAWILRSRCEWLPDGPGDGHFKGTTLGDLLS